jgi:enoyl-CoA hydratase
MFRFPRLVGSARAVEIMYLGDFIDAHEAERIGLVNEVVPSGEALPRASRLAQRIARQPRAAISAIKRAVRESALLPHSDAVQLTLKLSDLVFKTDDCREGVEAFFQKRKPKFKGATEGDPQ